MSTGLLYRTWFLPHHQGVPQQTQKSDIAALMLDLIQLVRHFGDVLMEMQQYTNPGLSKDPALKQELYLDLGVYMSA